MSAAAGAIALDPPSPDPDFRQREELPDREAAPNIGDLSTLAVLLLTIKNFMDVELAKSMIEGWRLGALQANDPRWAALHSQDLSTAVTRQLDAITEVQCLYPAAVAGLAQIIASISPADLSSQRRELLVSGTPRYANWGLTHARGDRSTQRPCSICGFGQTGTRRDCLPPHVGDHLREPDRHSYTRYLNLLTFDVVV